jgi:hypothetical protein
MRVLLKAVDMVANFLALLAFIFLIVAVVWWGASGLLQYLRSMWWDSEDRILLIIVGAGVAWRAFRWNALNEPTQDATVSKWKLRSHRKKKRHSSASSG